MFNVGYNILNKVKEETIDLVIFNYELSASQQKNLEEFLNCKVLDWTELILHIFAKRARTFEGKLQVELATLQHLSTRLVRVWTHLERQRGGVGYTNSGKSTLFNRLTNANVTTLNMPVVTLDLTVRSI